MPSSRRAATPGNLASVPDARGYRKLHADHVLQANEGCDFDFLRGRSPVVTNAVTYL